MSCVWLCMAAGVVSVMPLLSQVEMFTLSHVNLHSLRTSHDTQLRSNASKGTVAGRAEKLAYMLLQ